MWATSLHEVGRDEDEKAKKLVTEQIDADLEFSKFMLMTAGAKKNDRPN